MINLESSIRLMFLIEYGLFSSLHGIELPKNHALLRSCFNIDNLVDFSGPFFKSSPHFAVECWRNARVDLLNLRK